jgi:hypothetical protein
MYIYIYIFIYIHKIYVHIYIYIYIHKIYVHIYIYIYIHKKYIYIYIYIYTYTIKHQNGGYLKLLTSPSPNIKNVGFLITSTVFTVLITINLLLYLTENSRFKM